MHESRDTQSTNHHRLFLLAFSLPVRAVAAARDIILFAQSRQSYFLDKVNKTKRDETTLAHHGVLQTTTYDRRRQQTQKASL